MNVPFTVAHEPGANDQAHLTAIRDSVAAFTAQGGGLARIRSARGIPPGYERAVWQTMAELGWAGILVPEQHGGIALGLREACTIAEGLGQGAVPEPFMGVSVLAARAIIGGDNQALHDKLLGQIASGELTATLAWQEEPDGFHPGTAATQARPDGNGVRLQGRKRFVAAPDADGFVVSASTSEGLELFWVPRQAPGLEITTSLLADGTFDATLVLDSVPCGTEDRLASSACGTAALEQALDEAILASAAYLLGAARAVFRLTLDYLQTRKQFGRAIGSFQALQHRAVDCHVQIELASAVLDEAVETAASAQAAARSAIVSRAKARCIEAASLAAREAIQMHGAMGFTDECDVGLFVKRILTVSAWLGGAHHHRRRFALLYPVESFNTPHRGQSGLPPGLRDLPPDTDWNSLADEKFRALVRAFVEAEYPEEFRYLPRRVRWREVQDFYHKLGARGWSAPAWPRAWGGMGLSPVKQLIYIDEMERWGVGRAPDQGIRQLGAVLIRYGTEEQKAEYLPKILSFEHIWAQGYSEPNAGSDLASVTTTATQDGEEFVIDGTKIWTTLAQDATHIYVLCRTDKTVKKQEGISFIVLDLKTPGITMRSIRTLAGEEEFCQVFFDGVRTPKNNLIGGLNNGWTVAKAVLDFERLGIGSPNRPTIAFNRLTMLAREFGLLDDLGFLDDFTRLRLNLLDHASLYSRFSDQVRRGNGLGPDVSILKIWGMENFQRISEFLLDRAGAYGAQVGTVELQGDRTDLLAPYYMSRLVTIGGGSNEIQRNIIAKRVLDLPS